MARNYYCLVAGLREYTLDSEHKGFDALAIREEIREQLHPKDAALADLLYLWYDIENLVSIKAGRSAFNPLGNFTREELAEELTRPERLPAFLANVLAAYANPDDTDLEEIDRGKALERSLFEAYYAACAKSKNKFIRNWSEFDRSLRNVCAAFTARKMGRPVADVIVGGGYVAEALVRSSAADFGLKGEVEYIDKVMAAVADEEDLLGKEHRIDLLRWEMSEELNTFDYFNTDRILGYLVRVNLVQRWVGLDRERGEEMLSRLLQSLDGEALLDQAEKTNE